MTIETKHNLSENNKQPAISSALDAHRKDTKI